MTNRLGNDPFSNEQGKYDQRYLDLLLNAEKPKISQTKISIQNTPPQHHKNRPSLSSEEEKVYDYLKSNQNSTTIDISTGLNLWIFDALKILKNLEIQGLAQKVN